MNNDIQAALERSLRGAKRVLITTHVTPDGDALGSAFALAHIARHLGAEVRVLSVSGIPGLLAWLPRPAPVVRQVAELNGWTPDLVVFADCGDARRAGPEMAAFADRGQAPAPGWEKAATVNIDHHISNPGFARLNWVEADRAATGELVGLLAEHVGLELAGDLGEAIYLALVTDTGNFTFSNTSGGSLAMAARIVRAGLNVAAFTDKVENNWNLERMHLWGRLMSEISLHADGAIAVSCVPRHYLDERGLGKDDLEGYASWLRRLEGVRVALFIREDAPGRCKISLRSMGDYDVRAVAELYGGGGHASAAGAELELPPDEVSSIVLAELAARL